MNLKELREVIKDLPDDMPVIIASDEEGNDFHELDGWGVSAYERDGFFYYVLGDEDATEHDPRGLVLWP